MECFCPFTIILVHWGVSVTTGFPVWTVSAAQDGWTHEHQQPCWTFLLLLNTNKKNILPIDICGERKTHKEKQRCQNHRRRWLGFTRRSHHQFGPEGGAEEELGSEKVDDQPIQHSHAHCVVVVHINRHQRSVFADGIDTTSGSLSNTGLHPLNTHATR